MLKHGGLLGVAFCLSVCPSGTEPKVTRKKFITPHNSFVCKLQVSEALAGGLTSTSSSAAGRVDIIPSARVPNGQIYLYFTKSNIMAHPIDTYPGTCLVPESWIVQFTHDSL